MAFILFQKGTNASVDVRPAVVSVDFGGGGRPTIESGKRNGQVVERATEDLDIVRVQEVIHQCCLSWLEIHVATQQRSAYPTT